MNNQSDTLNQLFMTFLFIIMNMFLLKNHATHVVVETKTEMELLKLLILPKLKFSETEKKSCQEEVDNMETTNKEKKNQRNKISKKLSTITANFTDLKPFKDMDSDLISTMVMIYTVIVNTVEITKIWKMLLILLMKK